MIKRITHSALYKNRHYVLGLAFQKGLPFLLIPLIVSIFGKQTYSDFALICYAVQFLSVLFTLGLPSTLIVFWNEYEAKDTYLAMQFGLTLFTTLIFCLLILPFHAEIARVFGLTHISMFVFILLLIFIVVYNFSGMGVSVLRVLSLSKKYFYSVVLSSMMFIGFVLFAGRFAKNLPGLLSAYILSLFMQWVMISIFAKFKFSFNFTREKLQCFSKKMFSYSIPVMFYMVISTASITVDKWFVKSSFPSGVFRQYIFNFQFAYVINIISVVVGMYSLPMFCKNVADNDKKTLSQNVLTNYLLVLGVSIFAIAGSWGYAYLADITLSIGFFIFSAAFVFTNLFSINVSIFESYQISRKLLKSILLPTILFWIMFFLAIKESSIDLVYLDFFVYNLLVFLMTFTRLFKKQLISWY